MAKEKKDQEESGSKKINDKKCCRCVYRNEKKCTNKKSPKFDKYVPRKKTCNCFKYDE